MTDTTTEVDLNQLFDFQIDCAWEHPVCDKEAEYMVICNCCNQDTPLCMAHLVILKNHVAMNLIFAGLGTCGYCGVGGFATFDQWARVEKL